MHLVASSPPGLLVQEQLSAGVSHFPRSAPVLVKLMSGLATTQFKWTRVPAVVVFGSMAPDQQGEQYPCSKPASGLVCWHVLGLVQCGW